MKAKKFLALAALLCAVLGAAVRSEASALSAADDVISGVMQSAFKAAGRSADDIAQASASIFKRSGDSIMSFLRKSVDTSLLSKVDDVAETRRVLSMLPEAARKVYSGLAPVEQKIFVRASGLMSDLAKHGDEGLDIIRKMGRNGISIGTQFGTEALRKSYRITSGIIAALSEHGDEVLSAVRKIDLSSVKKTGLAISNSNLSLMHKATAKADDVSKATFEIFKKYGPKGLDSLQELTRKVGSAALANPKTSLAIVGGTIICMKSDDIFNKDGSLKEGVTDKMSNFTESVAKLMVVPAAKVSVAATKAAAAEVVGGVKETAGAVADRIFGEGMLSTVVTWILFILAILLIMYFIPVVNVVPKAIFGGLGRLLHIKKNQKDPQKSQS